MLEPKYLDALPESLIELYRQVEQDILTDMARRFAEYDYWIPAVEHQRQKLREMGLSQEHIIRILSQMSGKSQGEIKRLMQQACDKALESDRDYYRQHGFDAPSAKSAEMKTILNAGLKSTNQLFRNLAKTTASAGQVQFVNALDRAWLQINSGAFDYNTAIRNAVKDIARQGLQAIRYPSGHTDTLEVAVRRAVVTGINQTAAQMQLQLASEVGSDLVETTAHAGARPDHVEWQGQIFSLSGKHPKYPDFRQSTGYGTGAGLCGWNCRHSFNPYVEGSSRAYSEDLLEEYNAKKYIYNGKQLTEYEASQIQRYHERQIRRWKREYTMTKAAGLDTTEAAVKLRNWQERQKDFIEQTGLRRQSERERIVSGTKAVAKNNNRGIIKENRFMANGYRTSVSHILSESEIESIIHDAKELGIPQDVLIFNKGFQTGFSDFEEVIHIRGDILPDMSSKHPRDILSQRAVLAHEYYGHLKSHPSKFKVGDWRDEFRASYRAALDCPNLTDDERRSLMIDAYERAKEANVPVKYNDEARRVIYGYE